jgi:hypothetical protein
LTGPNRSVYCGYMVNTKHYASTQQNLQSFYKQEFTENVPEGASLIPLTQGLFALVDQDKFDELNTYSWSVSADHNTVYAVRGEKKEDGTHSTIRMHRQLMGIPTGDRTIIDHINGNGLDNRLSNLRKVTASENQLNRAKKKKSKKTTKFIGVVFRLTENSWLARIHVNNKFRKIGYFDNDVMAARAYDREVIKTFGPNAETNESLGLYGTALQDSVALKAITNTQSQVDVLREKIYELEDSKKKELDRLNGLIQLSNQINEDLKNQLVDALSRVKLLEDTLRTTESELKQLKSE